MCEKLQRTLRPQQGTCLYSHMLTEDFGSIAPRKIWLEVNIISKTSDLSAKAVLNNGQSILFAMKATAGSVEEMNNTSICDP